MTGTQRVLGVAGVLFALQAGTLEAQREGSGSSHPQFAEAFRQIIPRGRIASVDDPVYVSAAQARISDDAWVLGVVVGDQARAYSLNLLNRHEVVNDTIAGQTFAAVW